MLHEYYIGLLGCWDHMAERGARIGHRDCCGEDNTTRRCAAPSHLHLETAPWRVCQAKVAMS